MDTTQLHMATLCTTSAILQVSCHDLICSSRTRLSARDCYLHILPPGCSLEDRCSIFESDIFLLLGVQGLPRSSTVPYPAMKEAVVRVYG